MSTRSNTQDFRELFLSDTPLLDVRAPIEFEKGAFPHSCNLPLLDDEQRHEIGTRYKEQGQDAAVALGWELATEEVQNQRKQVWQQFAKQHPEGFLYCFRGGLRSRMSQQLIKEAGINYPMVEGGYKAMRRFLIDELELQVAATPFIRISGRTGIGKTRVLSDIQNAIDLEGLANHRGSAFGGNISPQPTQIDFENRLSIDLIKQRAAHQSPVFLEDEGRLIGRVYLPEVLLEKMHNSPMVTLETSLEERIEFALEDYITSALPLYRQHFGKEEGEIRFSEQILGNLSRIKKRLGAVRYAEMNGEFSEALTELFRNDKADGFRKGIEKLLTDYYDPMYDYQQSQRKGSILFKGDKDEVVAWANQQVNKEC